MYSGSDLMNDYCKKINIHSKIFRLVLSVRENFARAARWLAYGGSNMLGGVEVYGGTNT